MEKERARERDVQAILFLKDDLEAKRAQPECKS